MSTRTVLNLRQVACACFWKLAYFCLLMIGCTSAYHLSSMQWDSKHLGETSASTRVLITTPISGQNDKIEATIKGLGRINSYIPHLFNLVLCFANDVLSLSRQHEAPLFTILLPHSHRDSFASRICICDFQQRRRQ